MANFIELGLEKLWKGRQKRYIPIHHVYSNLGEYYCENLLRCHLGTGCDYISKDGTKKSALKANPDILL